MTRILLDQAPCTFMEPYISLQNRVIALRSSEVINSIWAFFCTSSSSEYRVFLVSRVNRPNVPSGRFILESGARVVLVASMT